MTLTEKAKPSQEPTAPYPYATEEVVVQTGVDGVSLAGTLTLPEGSGPFPAVVLIPGTGGTDRDEAVSGHRPFLVIADHLTRHGVAVLRCDKRGIGKSTGDFANALDSDFAEDALAQVAYLAGRSEIDRRHIGLIGHSEGGTVGPRAAVKSRDIAFLILLAGPGVPMEEVLLRQARDIAVADGVDGRLIEVNAAVQRDIFEIAKSWHDRSTMEDSMRKAFSEKLSSLPADLKKAAAAMESGGKMDAQIKLALSPWYRDILAYDPRPTLKAVACPILALNGEKDLQVAAAVNLVSIRDALKSGSSTRFTAVVLPGLNHLFQTCSTGSPSEYAAIDETFSPEALTLITDWLWETVRATKER